MTHAELELTLRVTGDGYAADLPSRALGSAADAAHGAQLFAAPRSAQPGLASVASSRAPTPHPSTPSAGAV